MWKGQETALEIVWTGKLLALRCVIFFAPCQIRLKTRLLHRRVSKKSRELSKSIQRIRYRRSSSTMWLELVEGWQYRSLWTRKRSLKLSFISFSCITPSGKIFLRRIFYTSAKRATCKILLVQLLLGQKRTCLTTRERHRKICGAEHVWIANEKHTSKSDNGNPKFLILQG